jgi:hypothetical protein
MYEGNQSPIYQTSMKSDASLSVFPQLNQDLSENVLSPVRPEQSFTLQLSPSE